MAATHTIRTTMRPGDEITVGHDEYEFLLEKGLIYDGTPPVEAADPFDTRFAEYFADPASATMVALRAAFAPQLVDLTKLTYPLTLPHRGAGADLVPENTRESFRVGSAYGLGAIDGGDIRMTADGTAVSLHDATVDAVTNESGNLSDYTVSAFNNLIVDAGTWFGGNRYGNLTRELVDFEWIVSTFGRTDVLFPEIKVDEAVAPTAAIIKRYGVQRSTVVQSFSGATLTALRAACPGVATLLLVNAGANSGLTGTQIKADGNDWVGLDINWASFDAKIADFLAAGLKVMVYTVKRQHEHDRAVTAGAHIVCSDNPLYSGRHYSKYRRTKDSLRSQTWTHGMITTTGRSTVQFAAPNKLRFPGPLQGSVLWGEMCPIAAAAGSYSLTGDFTFNAIGTDTSRWVAFFLAAPTDHPYNDAGAATDNGYLVMLRATGSIAFFRRINGVALAGPTLSTAAITAGATASLRVAVTPTGLTATRVDTGQSVTWAETTHRGGYFHVMKAGGTGLEVDASNIVVS